MLIQHLIDRYKSFRKKKYLNLPFQYKHQYAFIGVGQHSFSNLYPAIQFLGIPLKVIYTRHIQHAQQMAGRFINCTGTNTMATILEDKTIQGVFVSTDPAAHATIVKELLTAGKHVFVEKPPCFSMEELTMLINSQEEQLCIPGLQKRFCTINQLLQPYLSKAVTYSYRYLTGPYPEGNAIFELFIHPVDNLIHLFGDVKHIHIHTSGKNRLTHFLSVTHNNGVSGMLQLSTDHSWKYPVDELEINTESGIFQATYPFKLISTDKSARLLNIPMEKVFKSPAVKKIHLDNTGFIPVGEYNAISLQGFLGEIEYFVGITEGVQKKKPYHLESLIPAYRILEQLKNKL